MWPSIAQAQVSVPPSFGSKSYHRFNMTSSSSGVDKGLSPTPENVHKRSDVEKNSPDQSSRNGPVRANPKSSMEGETGSLPPSYDNTHRKLKPRHIQLIGIGGTIGTALYVQIGRGLMQGGPASLFMAFTIWYVQFDLNISQLL